MSLSLPQMTCSVCNQPIGQPLPGKIYCCRKCRLKAGRRAARAIDKLLRKGEIIKPREKRNCEQCNTLFTPQRATQTFCSAKCRNRASNKRNSLWSKARQKASGNPRPWLVLKSCKHCGKEFQPRHPMQLYCDLYCRVLHDGQSHAQALKALQRGEP